MMGINREGVAIVKDIIHGSIVLTELERFILRDPLIDRLQNIKQQALVYRVYPGATHTRLAHSLGTMHYASNMFTYALINSNPKLRNQYLKYKLEVILKHMFLNHEAIEKIYADLYAEFITYINNNNVIFDKGITNYIEDLVACHNNNLKVSINKVEKLIKEHIIYLTGKPFAATVIGSNMTQSDAVYLLHLLLVRLRALLHDLGHLPFSHITEFAFPKDSTGDSTKKLHESLSEKLAYKIIINNIYNTYNILEVSDVDINSLFIVPIILIYSYVHFDLLFYEIKSGILDSEGGIDADRVDYVLRDGLHTSMFPSSGDIERIYKTYKLVKTTKNYLLENGFIGYYKVMSEKYNVNKSLSKLLKNSQLKENCNLNINMQYYLILPTTHSYNDIIEVLYDRYRIHKYVNNHHRTKRLDGMLERTINLIFDQLDSNKLNLNKLNKDDKEYQNIATDIKNVIQDIQRMKETVIEFINNKNYDYYHKLIQFTYQFMLFDDSWLIIKLKELYSKLKMLRHKIDNEHLTKIVNYLSEIFAERTYISLWKREADYHYHLVQFQKSIDHPSINFKCINFIQEAIDDKSGFNDILLQYLKSKLFQLLIHLKIIIKADRNMQTEVASLLENKIVSGFEYISDAVAIFNYIKTGLRDDYPVALADLRNSANDNIYKLSDFSQTLSTISLEDSLSFPYYIYVLPNPTHDSRLDRKFYNDVICYMITSMLFVIVRNNKAKDVLNDTLQTFR